MPEDTIANTTDPGTYWPKAPALKTKSDHFEPMKLPDFEPEIHLPDHMSPDDPIIIFTLYYTPEIIEQIIESTNLNSRQPKDPSKPKARAYSWVLTTSGEIYIYFAIRIYMTLHIENKIADYWNTQKATPIHSISKYITRDRFQELYIRFCYKEPESKGPYGRVCSTPISLVFY
jgi:Transposase IS4